MTQLEQLFRMTSLAGKRPGDLVFAILGVWFVALMGALAFPSIWPAELLISLAPQAVVAGVAGVLWSMRRRAYWRTGLAVALAFGGWIGRADQVVIAAPAANPDGAVIVWSNVFGMPKALKQSLALAIEKDANVLVIGEHPRAAETPTDLLADVKAAYPFEASPEVTRGVKIYSRTPLEDVRTTRRGFKRSVAARLTVGGQDIDLIAVHLPTPMSPAGVKWRGKFFEETLSLYRRGRPTLMVGDFNATHWSRPFVDQLDGTQFARLDIGGRATWMSRMAGVGLPIDHAFVSGDLAGAAEVGPDTASDHFPLIVQLAAGADAPIVEINVETKISPETLADEQSDRPARPTP